MAGAAGAGGGGGAAAASSGGATASSGAANGTASAASQSKGGAQRGNSASSQSSGSDLATASFPARNGDSSKVSSESLRTASGESALALLSVPHQSASEKAALLAFFREGPRNGPIESSRRVTTNPALQERTAEGGRAEAKLRRGVQPEVVESTATRGREQIIGLRDASRRPQERSLQHAGFAEVSGESFGKSLSEFRAQGREALSQRRDSRAEKRDDPPIIDDEEQLTRHYRELLQVLVQQGFISKEAAAPIRQKAGKDLAAAVMQCGLRG